MGAARLSRREECCLLCKRWLRRCHLYRQNTSENVVLFLQFDPPLCPHSVHGCLGFLFSSRVWRESDPGDHYTHVTDLLHERGVRHATALVGNTSNRYLFLVYYDHGGQLGGLHHHGVELPSQIGYR